MPHLILADNQEITRAGILYACGRSGDWTTTLVEDKGGLIERLKEHPSAVIVMDYTLFDLNDFEELDILHLRFPEVQWVMFSTDLSADFVRQLLATSPRFSILLKESPLQEVYDCLAAASRRQRYICQRMAELLLTAPTERLKEEARLTPTETEILKDIALGMTTREIAERRVSSFHTVNTHRKNIFRKLGVNNAHEATKYALRAGLVDAAEYYI